MKQELYVLGSSLLSHPARLTIYVSHIYVVVFFLFKDKRIARQFGYSARGILAVVEDFS